MENRQALFGIVQQILRVASSRLLDILDLLICLLNFCFQLGYPCFCPLSLPRLVLGVPLLDIGCVSRVFVPPFRIHELLLQTDTRDERDVLTRRILPQRRELGSNVRERLLRESLGVEGLGVALQRQVSQSPGSPPVVKTPTDLLQRLVLPRHVCVLLKVLRIRLLQVTNAFDAVFQCFTLD